MENKHVRVRFAPSPTGPLHIGGVRTALYNYLFAKQNNGDFILRIEDTDQTRHVKGAEEYIIESLKWCNIRFNEGVTAGGAHAPYRQSERKEIYRKYAEQLVQSGTAYYAFDTPEALEAMRKRQESSKASYTGYNYKERMEMKNSLSLPEVEVNRLIESSQPYVIRFKIPRNENIIFYDYIRKDLIFNSSTLDDKVLFKSDGLPTYHLANVVDDYLMQITHVIRGEEWLPSTPLHVLLYKAFGWEENMPQFAHLPLLLKPDGKGKLSKRDGDMLGFPVFPIAWHSPDGEIYSGFRESGYLPEAFINLIALLGWNPGTEKEIFLMDELIEAFSIERITKAGARFDPEKAKWFNHYYLQQKDLDELAIEFDKLLKGKGINSESGYIKQVIFLVKERITFVKDLWDQGSFFFIAPEKYDSEIIKKRWKTDTADNLKQIIELLKKTELLIDENLEQLVKEYITNNQMNPGQMLNCLRLCLVGESKGPELFKIIDLIGRDETIKRINRAIKIINV